MEAELTQYQSSPESPWSETELTEEEQIRCIPGERLSRALHLFEFRKLGVPISLPIGQPKAAYQDITAVGIVSTLTGKEGLFAQCCWFGNYDLDWFWCRITNIEAARVICDMRFRGGAKCLWVSSTHGDYALLVPRTTYVDVWEASLHSFGPTAREALVAVWPTQGTRPDWWDVRWKKFWPFDKDPEPMEIDGHPDGNSGWPRFGPCGDFRYPGEPLSHLHVLSPWVISPDGLKPSERE